MTAASASSASATVSGGNSLLVGFPHSGGVCRELARVDAPGAPIVIGFQSGDGKKADRASSYGRPVPLYRGDAIGADAAAR